MDCRQWTGLGFSLVLAMFCGISTSFNVYAVKLKSSFRLNQSQVELVASFIEIGWSFQIITAWVIKRFGYQACYFLVLFLTASSSLLMWAATHYVPFFRANIWLMGFFQLLNVAGATGGFQCITAIAAENFPKKHTGKVFAVYMATIVFGRMYYVILFDIFFEQQDTLGYFFLTLAISFATLVILCYFVHRQPTKEDSDSDICLKRHDTSEELIQERAVDESEEMQLEDHSVNKSPLRDLLSSSYFYFMAGGYVLFNTGSHTFINNITGIGTAVGTKHPLNLVNILCVGTIISRLGFGALFDYFHSMRNRFIIIFLPCLFFFFSMIICIFWLDGSTIYVVIAMASISCGAVAFLFLIMLVSEFGTSYYPILTGVLQIFYAPAALISHLGAGWTYDNAALQSQTRGLFCKECFYGTYVIVLSLVTAVILLHIVNSVVCYIKLRR